MFQELGLMTPKAKVPALSSANAQTSPTTPPSAARSSQAGTSRCDEGIPRRL